MDRFFGIGVSSAESDVAAAVADALPRKDRREVYRAMMGRAVRSGSSRQDSRRESDASHSQTLANPSDAEFHVDVAPLPPDHHPFHYTGPGVPYEFRGCEPPHSNVPRTVDLNQQKWDGFLKASLGRPASGMFTNFFQTQDDYDYYEPHQSEPDTPAHRSVLGFPVWSPYSRRYRLWTLLINLIDATYTAFWIPIIVAFTGRSSDASKNLTTIVELVFGGIMLQDILISLHVGFVIHYDYKKKVVMDGKHILWYYIKFGGAWIDILSVVPFFFELFVLIFLGFGNQSDDVAGLRLFRLLRIFRILKRIYGLSFANSSVKICGCNIPGGMVYLLSVIYSMLVMMNFLGCLLFYIADWESDDLSGTWIYKYTAATNDVPETVTDAHAYILQLIAEQTQPELYLTSLYWAVTTVTTVGYGDITPNSSTEMIALIFVMLSHIMLFGLLIGSISELVRGSFKSVQFREETNKKKSAIGKWMKYRRLDDPTIKKINSYYAEIERQSTEFDEEEILEELPISLRIEVIYKVTRTLMRRLKVFSDIEVATLKKVAGRLIPVTLPPGHELVRQGDVADALYILEVGQMAVLFNEAIVYYMEGPETCAETGILSNFIPQLTRYPVTLRTFTSCVLWKLRSKDLLPVFAMDPRLRTALTEGFRRRLLKSLGSNLRTRELEKKVEAEFGCKMSAAQASLLRSSLENTRVPDGTFRQLVENVVTGKFAEESAERLKRFQRVDANEDDTSMRSRLIAVKSARNLADKEYMQEILYRIRQQSEFGMVAFVSHLKKTADINGKIDLDGLKDGPESLKTFLKPRILLLLFSLFDPFETERIDIDSMTDELRDLLDFSGRESHVSKIFDDLTNTEQNGGGVGLLSLADLMRSFRVENHPKVLLHQMSTSAALNEVVAAFSHEDVTRQHFIDFHRDLGLCVPDDSRFLELTRTLWAVEGKKQK